MSNAEHLIENAIFAIKRGRDLEEELDKGINKMMLDATGMSKEDVIGMANHVVYSLYDGRLPDDAIRDLAPVQQLTDLDLLELEHRFGKYVRVVVEDMIEKNMK